MKKIPNGRYRTWVEISKKAIENNYRLFRKVIKPETRLLGVVKCNAYGHGLVGFSRILTRLGIDWLGVDSITEADTLRRAGIKKPILVLGHTLPENFAWAQTNDIALTISTLEGLRAVVKKRFDFPIHVKLETGLNRQGFSPEDLSAVMAFLKKNPDLNIQGVYTHFAKAYYPGDRRYTRSQLKEFSEGQRLFANAGYKPIFHAAATGGTLNFPESHFDMVRVGIGLYGLWPTAETEEVHAKKMELAPALTWKTRVCEIQTARRGESVGYYRYEKLRRDSRLAVLPVGYWHGFDRRFSSIGQVLIRGKKCKVIGRVSMAMVVVDVTKVPGANVGDEVVLIGEQAGNVRLANDLATDAGTIKYEIITRINPLIPKYYV